MRRIWRFLSAESIEVDLKEPKRTSDSARLVESPLMGSCTRRYGNERQYYVTNQQTHINKTRFIIHYNSRTCFGHFSGHLHGVMQDYKQ